MKSLQSYVGTPIEVEVSGAKWLHGTLAELGSDLIILKIDDKFYYVPFCHVHQIRPSTSTSATLSVTRVPTPIQVNSDSISYRNLLLHMRGKFVEIFVSNKETVHGYVTSVMTNYFAFHSPLYKTVYISLEHLKWLIPYPENVTPYSLEPSQMPTLPSTLTLSRTFEEQCKKMVGSLVAFDFGDKPDKIGLLTNVDNNRVTLITANGSLSHWNLKHVKSVHLP